VRAGVGLVAVLVEPMISAPYIRSSWRRSSLVFSGMTTISR